MTTTPWQRHIEPALTEARAWHRALATEFIGDHRYSHLDHRARELVFLLAARGAIHARLAELTGEPDSHRSPGIARTELHNLADTLETARRNAANQPTAQTRSADRSSSVHTVRGGLPTLGRRRR